MAKAPKKTGKKPTTRRGRQIDRAVSAASGKTKPKRKRNT